jgi:hypothetical protein
VENTQAPNAWDAARSSHRYTVAIFPLPDKNVLMYRMREYVGSISILAFNTKCTREYRPHFTACGTPDRALAILNLSGCLLALAIEYRTHLDLAAPLPCAGHATRNPAIEEKKKLRGTLKAYTISSQKKRAAC